MRKRGEGKETWRRKKGCEVFDGTGSEKEEKEEKEKKEKKEEKEEKEMFDATGLGFYTYPFSVGKEAGSDSSAGKINLGKIDYTSRLIF